MQCAEKNSCTKLPASSATATTLPCSHLARCSFQTRHWLPGNSPNPLLQLLISLALCPTISAFSAFYLCIVLLYVNFMCFKYLQKPMGIKAIRTLSHSLTTSVLQLISSNNTLSSALPCYTVIPVEPWPNGRWFEGMKGCNSQALTRKHFKGVKQNNISICSQLSRIPPSVGTKRLHLLQPRFHTGHSQSFQAI